MTLTKNIKKRKVKIPEETEAMVMFSSNRECCICNKKGDHIHHLDGNNSNNKIENLALLCFDHHHEATVTGGLSKKLSKKTILKYRDHHYALIDKKRRVGITEVGKEIDVLQRKNYTETKLGSLQANPDNLLCRKNFSIAELAEFTNLLGFDSVIREIDNSEMFNTHTRDFWHYSNVGTPKCLIFATSTDEQTGIGNARIKSVKFNNKKIFITKGLHLGKLEWNFPDELTIEYNHVEYKLSINEDFTFSATSNKISYLNGKKLGPLFLLFCIPEDITIRSEDIYTELIMIDFILKLLLEGKIRESQKIIWTYRLEPKYKIDNKVLRTLKGIDTEEFYWVLNGNLNHNELIKIIFYNDKNGKIKMKPFIESKELDTILRSFIKKNGNEFRKSNFSSSFLDYYLLID